MAPHLQYDFLILVMKILPFKDRVICESVCKEWFVAATECTATYQTSVCIFSKKSNVDKNCIQNFCDDWSHRISFEHDCIFAFDCLPVMSILRKCRNLKVLHLKCYEEESLDMEGIESLGYNCPKIEHFSLSDDTRGCYVYKDCLTMVQNCMLLKHLQLRFPAESTLDFLIENAILRKSLLMHGTNITTLSTNLPLSSDNCSLLTECPLSQLLLRGTSSTLEGLTMICTAPTQFLQVLSIVIDWVVQLNLISEFMVNLQCLRCTIANPDITSVKCLSSLTNLRKLFLSVWAKNNLDEDMIEIMRGCRKLESLTVNGEMTDKSLVLLSEFCPEIQRLELAMNSEAKDITDEAIERSLCRLPNLRYLSLRNCDVTDRGFEILITSCLNLNLVRLSTAPRLTLPHVLMLLEREAGVSSRRKIRAVMPEKLAADFDKRWLDHHPNLTVMFE